jgi:uncharacterized protein (TIGR00730 family)
MRICVYCGSNSGRSPAYAAAARELGALMAGRSIGLVYGGGNVGLMGIIADAALAAGGEVIGVIPRPLVDRELAHPGLSELRVTGSMHERKQLMHDLSDGFVALPGGFGTLDELFETLTWAQLGVHAKPMGLLDVDGFWQPLLRMVEQQVSAELVLPQYAAMLLHATSASELLERLAAYRPPQLTKWADRTQT